MWIAVIVIIGLVFLLMFLGENEFQKEQDNLLYNWVITYNTNTL